MPIFSKSNSASFLEAPTSEHNFMNFCLIPSYSLELSLSLLDNFKTSDLSVEFKTIIKSALGLSRRTVKKLLTGSFSFAQFHEFLDVFICIYSLFKLSFRQSKSSMPSNLIELNEHCAL